MVDFSNFSSSNFRRYPRAGWIAGVCMGIAVYFDWNVKLIRVLAVIAFFFSGVFPLAIIYGVLWYVMSDARGLPGDSSGRDNLASTPGMRRTYPSNGEVHRPARSMGEIKARFERMESRLRGMEECVASNDFELRRELRKLES